MTPVYSGIGFETPGETNPVTNGSLSHTTPTPHRACDRMIVIRQQLVYL